MSIIVFLLVTAFLSRFIGPSKNNSNRSTTLNIPKKSRSSDEKEKSINGK